ncbi:MAG: hypothetical protein RL024_753, partial [Actinomycetota bacterium]
GWQAAGMADHRGVHGYLGSEPKGQNRLIDKAVENPLQEIAGGFTFLPWLT